MHAAHGFLANRSLRDTRWMQNTNYRRNPQTFHPILRGLSINERLSPTGAFV